MMCCYYPTTTVAIDDDIDFLGLITQHLGINDCISYSSPKEALKSLGSQKNYSRTKNRVLKSNTVIEDDSLAPEDIVFTINLRKLHEEIYYPQRFQDVSVIIVDYHMDDISGIDVCEALLKHPAKKILLTGGVNKENIAISAFNKNIIHRFINKSDPNFPTLLKQAIATLKEAYFRDLSSTLIPYLSAETKHILQNPAYINLVRNLQEQFNAIEYYLIDASGSIVYLDQKGFPTWLIIKNQTELDNYKKIAEDHEASGELVARFTSGKYIPFFFSEEDFNSSISDWGTCYLHWAQAFPGLKNYYYAIENGHIRNNLNIKKIVPYAA